MKSKERKNRSLPPITKGVITKIWCLISCLVLAIFVSSCVSMKSYREVKANLIYQELTLEEYRFALDSLKEHYADMEKEFKTKDAELKKRDAKIKTLEEEYDLLLEEYSREME